MDPWIHGSAASSAAGAAAGAAASAATVYTYYVIKYGGALRAPLYLRDKCVQQQQEQQQLQQQL